MLKRLVTNVCFDRLAESRDFYVALLEMNVQYESDWYIQLGADGYELGIIQRDYELVPAQYQQSPTGMYLTFVVDDVETVYAKAIAMGCKIIQPPRDEFYGQRRLLLCDPNGCLVDISSVIQIGFVPKQQDLSN